MKREIDIEAVVMGMELEHERSDEQYLQPYEAMVSRVIETGYRERSLQEIEDVKVASDLLHDLTWQEREPLFRRLGNVRGMMRYLRGRPGQFHKAELALLKALRQLEEWGEALVSFDPDNASMAEELHQAAERCHFEDALFAATTDFFDLVERLDEPWGV